MKVAYILHSTEAHGGATKAFINMLSSLTPLGIKPLVIIPGKDGVFLELTKRRIPTIVLTYRSSTYPFFHTMKERLLFLPKLVAKMIVNHNATKELKTILIEHQIDIVHSNTSIVRIGFDAAQQVGIPHIYHIREYAKKIGYHYFPTLASFARQLNLPHSYTICITKAIQHYYALEDKKQSSRIIYDGVLSQISEMPLCHDKDYFLFAGRIQPAKGLDQLLQAYKIYLGMVKSPLPLKIAGSNGDVQYYQNQQKFIRDNHLSSYVSFLGDRDDISDLMQHARALIVSSPFEGFGFCMPEAMQQGCLVIGRNTSGTKEQLDNGLEITGREIALRYETTTQLAELLSEVANNPASFYYNYTQNAFNVVTQLYTKDHHAKEIYRFYEEITAQ